VNLFEMSILGGVIAAITNLAIKLIIKRAQSKAHKKWVQDKDWPNT